MRRADETGPNATIPVRTATPTDRLTVRRILDAAMLEVGDVDARLEAGDVLVATAGAAESGEDERILGALVCEPRDDGAHVTAVAVRTQQRDRGIGTVLVETALERERRLTAHFDEGVRPFYEALAFSIRRIDEERYRGERSGDP